MLEYFIVMGIVLVAVVLTVRSLHKTLTGRNDGCSCGRLCPNCALEKQKEKTANKRKKTGS